MTDPVTRAQLILLARTLHVSPERIAHLERLGPHNLHELQERMARIIFDQHAETFRRISRLVPVIPLGISMPLVQKLVPPTLTGRAAGAVGLDHPRKAAETVSLLGVGYAADCAPYLDPRTVGELADIAPPGPIVDIVNEVLRRHDYITAGPFLGYASSRLVEAVERGVPDDEGLIYSASYAYSSTALSSVLRQLLNGPAQRMPRMIRTVLTGSPELRLAALSIFARCDADVVSAIGEITISVGTPAALCDLVLTAIQGRTVPALTTFLGTLSEPSLAAVAALPVYSDPAVVAALVQALNGCHESAPWQGLFAVLARTDPALRPMLARTLAQQADDIIGALPSHATEADLWPILLDIVAAGDHPVQNRIGRVWAMLSPERRAGVLWHLDAHGDDPRLTTVAAAVRASSVSVEEVFFRRRQIGRRRGTVDSWDAV
ncbi:hypothetical protein NONO_c25070 [Nocardia nova SH22a]|uniref:Uncharacterized protein n=1 Tax=Nocardia nova SH22a TaxID=1415166 RepID=W5TDI9_9NOCA|nr:hypothetical protein [Nocardia nova]AHH17302.1 hypothetical protein NONO_c25070 [Nocardia nova SH22a]